MAEDLPPIRMVVGEVIPAGLLLLAGDPKTGKSLLLQDLALSVAVGSPAWGSLPVEEGDVLYLAREGGKHSFRDRLAKMLGAAPAPERFHIAYESQALRSGLEDQLAEWLAAQAAPRLVVIDTYAAVSPVLRGVSLVTEEYKALAGLASLAQDYPDALIVVVHHTRKADGEDVMHRISGSNGMTAATDGNAVLARHPAASRCTLHIRPRNAEESDLVLERRADLRWTVVGDDERAQLGSTRQRVLAFAEQVGGSFSAADVAEGLQDIDPANVRQTLKKMADAHQLVRTERGRYSSTG